MDTATSQGFHIPVLLEESITSLALVSGDIVVDGTFGGGGHSRAILEFARAAQLELQLVCVDLDEAALVRFQERIVTAFPDAPVRLVHSNFKDVAHIKAAADIDSPATPVSKVLLDLGTSTFQLLADTRGFSFMSDTPLAMTFSEAGSHTGFTARDVVNDWQEDSIADIIFGFGEERLSRKIARAIVAAREVAPIVTAKQLADIIGAAVPRRGRIHPATKTFQALRIAVNDELGVITEALDGWWTQLPPGGRISVITFHSLEDRVVKRWMLARAEQSEGANRAILLTKKPIAPSEQELSHNPRSRSAKLRTIQKI